MSAVVVASELTDTLLTWVLIAGISVSAISLVVLAFERSSHRRAARVPRPAPPPPPAVLAGPQSAVALARARASDAAARERVAAGRPPTDPDRPGPTRTPAAAAVPGTPALGAPPRRTPIEATANERPTIDDVRAIVDHLLDTNPRFLAEVITRWIHADEPRSGPT